MKISIVVPAFNEERLLAHSLAHIRQAARVWEQRGWTTETIVCDNNSTDKTAEIARAAGAMVVFEPVNQISRARNRGAAAATGDWLVFVDADSSPTAGLFADVAQTIASGQCLAGGVTVKMEGRHPLADLVVRIWNCASRLLKLPAGSFIFCEAAAFRTIGGFSEELFAGEELDLGKRLNALARRSGKRMIILRRHPLLTSARKLHLYSVREHLRVIARATLNPRTLASREACHLWYDGRR